MTAGAVLFAVLALVVARPRGLDVAWPAGVGALVALALGLVPRALLRLIVHDTWDAAATLIALVLLSEALASNGVFTWAALHLARLARGSGWRLYALVLLLTTAVTAVLANDGAVLMLTPVFATLLRTIYPDDRARLPFLFAGGFFADAMSAILVPSNLTNIILADANGLALGRAAMWMALPTAAAFVAGGAAFALRFRARIGTPYDPALLPAPATAIRDRVAFRLGWCVLAGLIVGYVYCSRTHRPVALGAGSAALAMLAVVRARRLRPLGEIVRAAPWGVIAYALGMFVVITAAYHAHALDVVLAPIRARVAPGAGPAGAIVAGTVLALLAAAVNNLPATLVGVLALRAAGGAAPVAVYAILLGVDIGPKLTPFGSLATLLWLGLLARHGIRVSWSEYLRENAWVTVVALGAAFAGLLAANAILG